MQKDSGGYFSRPATAGESPAAGFRFEQAQKVQIDLVGTRKSALSNDKAQDFKDTLSDFRK